MRMLNAERVWTTEERDRAEKALILMSEESDKAGKALMLLSKVEDFLKGKESTSTNVATQTEEPAISAASTHRPVVRLPPPPPPPPSWMKPPPIPPYRLAAKPPQR